MWIICFNLKLGPWALLTLDSLFPLTAKLVSSHKAFKVPSTYILKFLQHMEYATWIDHSWVQELKMCSYNKKIIILIWVFMKVIGAYCSYIKLATVLRTSTVFLNVSYYYICYLYWGMKKWGYKLASCTKPKYSRMSPTQKYSSNRNYRFKRSPHI